VPDWSKPVILALLALALLFAVRSQMASLRARRLERQRQQLLADVGLLQAALLPEIPERVGDLAASVAYRPADGPGAGGDFYDVFAFGSGRVAIIVGDVSGHGREALARATLMRYTLRAYGEAGLEPREALDLAEQVLGTDGHGGSKVSGDFTTVAMAVYDGAAATLTYALAGHPPPVLIGAPVPEPEGAGYAPPIGWGMPTGQRQTTIALPGGAVACFFTDGLTEAREGGRPFGREQLADELAAGGPETSAGAVLDRLVARADDTPDDMAACVVRTPPRDAPRAAVRIEELVVAPSEADGPGAERFLTACGVREGDVALALQSTRRMSREFEGAVLYVRIDAAGASVKVAGVRSGPDDRRSLRAVEPASSLAS
jgi:serine phosphatase RsbU (regulator of sigma subunit)